MENADDNLPVELEEFRRKDIKEWTTCSISNTNLNITWRSGSGREPKARVPWPGFLWNYARLVVIWKGFRGSMQSQI